MVWSAELAQREFKSEIRVCLAVEYDTPRVSSEECQVNFSRDAKASYRSQFE